MLYIIVNPASKSGQGRKRWTTLKQELDRYHMVYEVFFTQKDRGAKECVEKVLENCAFHDPRSNRQNILAVLGGDGTMNEVINVLHASDFWETIRSDRLALAYLPTGSSNDLAKALHITSSPEELIAHIRKPAKQRISDLGTVITSKGKQRDFCVSCGIGLDAAVCREALDSGLKNTLNRFGLGKLTYAGIAVKQLISAPLADCQLVLDDGTTRHFKKLLFAVAMIHPYEGGGIKMAPMADCRDGQFDIMIIAGLRKWRALYLLPLAFFGLHTKAENVYFFKSRTLTIKTDIPMVVHTDGEYCGMQQEISFSCQKDDLKIL